MFGTCHTLYVCICMCVYIYIYILYIVIDLELCIQIYDESDVHPRQRFGSLDVTPNFNDKTRVGEDLPLQEGPFIIAVDNREGKLGLCKQRAALNAGGVLLFTCPGPRCNNYGSHLRCLTFPDVWILTIIAIIFVYSYYSYCNYFSYYS